MIDIRDSYAYLLLEKNSLNTTQNARNTATLLRKREFLKGNMVNSAYHMGRSKTLFESEGLNVFAATAYQGRSMSSWRQGVSTTEALDDNSKSIMEIVGRRAGH